MSEFKAVRIVFWDHSSGSAADLTLCKCEVWGVLREENDLAYIVISWICDEDLKEANSDAYCILKSSVILYQELEVKDASTDERGYKEGERKS